MWSILTALLLAIVGLLAGWVSAQRQREWPIRLSVLAITILFTGLNQWAAKHESDSRLKVFTAGPPSIEDILNILQSAKTSIYIAANFAAYADFSRPDFFANYVRTLKEQHTKHGVRITLIVPDPAIRKEQLRLEFGDRWRAYQAWLTRSPIEESALRNLPETSADFDRKLRAYCGKTPLPTNLDGLVAIIFDHEEALIAAARGSYIEPIIERGRIPFSVWIADDSYALFYAGGISQQLSTRDGRLIEVLKSAVGSAIGN